jgi:hypothetical protein
MALSTADCRKWLSTDAKVQQLVKDRVGYDPNPAIFLAQCENNPQEVAFWTTWITNGANPKKWKRQSKCKVGSKTDLASWHPVGDAEGIAYAKQSLGVDPTGGILRNFWLEDTDHITVSILEVGGQLYLYDDLSD